MRDWSSDVCSSDRPYMAFGTPGGDQQDQWQTIFFLRHAVYGLNLQGAIDVPSFHNEHFPSSFYPRQATPGRLVVEGRFSAATVAELRQRGNRVEVGENWSEGRLCAAAQEDGILKAGANPRVMQGDRKSIVSGKRGYGRVKFWGRREIKKK